MLFERIFNDNRTKDQVLLFELITYNYLWPLCFSILFTCIGLMIQNIWPQSQKCAQSALKRISILYILNYFFLMIGFVLLVTFTFKKSFYSPSSFSAFLVNHDISNELYSHSNINVYSIFQIDFVQFSLPMSGFIVAYIIAKMFKFSSDKCKAIAVESTILNFCNTIYVYNITLYIIDFI